MRPHLEYGQSVWSPKYIRQSKTLENVQRRATKIVPGLKNLSYNDRLRLLDLPSLKYRRLRGDLITVYNIFKNDNSNVIKKFFKQNTIGEKTRGHSLKISKEVEILDTTPSLKE